jgi:hypothetical protein
VVVGAYGDDDNGYGSGSAYIFRRDQSGDGAWGQVATLTAADGASGDLLRLCGFDQRRHRRRRGSLRTTTTGRILGLGLRFRARVRGALMPGAGG